MLPPARAASHNDPTFTLTGVQVSATTIAAGSLVGTTDGDYVFSTSTALVIPAGSLTGSVAASCTTAGSGGNGYLSSTTPPQVSVVLGSQPLVASAVNTATTAGGTDLETDNHYRTRIQAAPNNLTTGGPGNQYRSLALDVSDTIVDAQIPTTPTAPGTVTVYILTGPVSQPAASPNAGRHRFREPYIERFCRPQRPNSPPSLRHRRHSPGDRG
jgi:uncharacterized phage protein gp47/JayE